MQDFDGDASAVGIKVVNPDFETNVGSTVYSGAGTSMDLSGIVAAISGGNPTIHAAPGNAANGFPSNAWRVEQQPNYLLLKKVGGTKQWGFGLQATDHAFYVAGPIAKDGNAGVPTAAAGANAGSSPPAPVRNNCSDLAGNITFGTGTGPAAGAQVVLTFSQTLPGTARVVLEEQNAATAALQLYVSAESTGAFTVSCVNAPAAGQGNTVYSFDYHVIC